MECSNSNGKEIVVDVESGGGRALGFNGSSEVEGETSLQSKRILREPIDESHESVRLLIEKNPNGCEGQGFTPAMDKRCEKERSKFGKAKKPPKPPRPPKGPTLDAGDMKFMKEISVLATKRRERAERMKALKKIRMAKSSSSSSSSPCGTIPAMIITILFCLVIIFQGLGSESSSPVIYSGAPEPAMMNRGFISVEFQNNGLWTDDRPSSSSPYSGEELSGLDLRAEE